MVENWLAQMKKEAEPPRAFKPHSIRIPAKVDGEIREFCEANDLPLSVVTRKCIQLGWEQIKIAIDARRG